MVTLNEELADTNRGVLALYVDLDEKATELQGITERLVPSCINQHNIA